jgi:hypothetical protein
MNVQSLEHEGDAWFLYMVQNLKLDRVIGHHNYHSKNTMNTHRPQTLHRIENASSFNERSDFILENTTTTSLSTIRVHYNE